MSSESYEELTSALLADIADLLLNSKDWSALERLRAALRPPEPYGPIYIGTTPESSDPAVTRVLNGDYMREMLDLPRYLQVEGKWGASVGMWEYYAKHWDEKPSDGPKGDGKTDGKT